MVYFTFIFFNQKIILNIKIELFYSSLIFVQKNNTHTLQSNSILFLGQK